MAPTTKPPAARRPEEETLLNLMLAAELYRGRRGTGKGTRRQLAQLAKKIERTRS